MSDDGEALLRARDLRLLVLDVDGVLTDGRIYLTAEGETTKVFHVRDGAGIVAVLRAGIEVAVVSGRDSAAVTRRAAELGILHLRQGVGDKLRAFEELSAVLGIEPRHCACIGDDTPDLPLFERVGFAVAVADAHPELRARAHWVTSQPGGQGAVRELCDLLLRARS